VFAVCIAGGLGSVRAEEPAKPLAAEPVVFGEYLEARGAAITAGFAELASLESGARRDARRPRECPLSHRAVLAWRIEHGCWDGEDLTGLAIVAVVVSEAPLDPERSGIAGAARAVLLVDERASERARQALVSLAREMAPRQLLEVIEVRPRRLTFERRADAVELRAHGPAGKAQLRIAPHTHSEEICASVCGGSDPPQQTLARHVESRVGTALAEADSASLPPEPTGAQLGGEVALAGRFAL
jgi:hypothetical protein